MIPVKLELTNFLAYRNPLPLDFTGLHLAVLVGSNGAGKSSLLDALTWALWGKARTTRDNDLIHTGETEMTVRLVFLLDRNEYRVTRYRSSKGRGQTALSLEIRDGDAWRNISENTVRTTQGTLDVLLKLDYDTFINSAYLVQGRADEFTSKTPGERKRILGEILGLERWAVFEERARTHIRQIDNERALNETRLGDIDEELGREDVYKEALAEAEAELERLTDELELMDAHYREMEAENRRLEDLRRNQREAGKTLDANQAEIDSIAEEQRRTEARLAELDAVIARRESIEKGFEAYQQAIEQDKQLNEQYRRQSELRQQQADLRQAITEARAGLEARLSALNQQAGTLQSTLDEAGDVSLFEERQAEFEELQVLEANLTTWREELTTTRQAVADLNSENSGLKAKMNPMAEQRDTLQKTTEPICPTCGQPLSEEDREALIERLFHDGTELGNQHRANTETLRQLTDDVIELEKSIKQSELELKQMPSLQSWLDMQKDRIEKASEAQQALASVQAEMAEVEAAIQDGSFAPELTTNLHEVEAALDKLGYSEETHLAAQKHIEDFKDFEELSRTLALALEEAPRRQEEIDGRAVRLQQWGERQAEIRERMAECEAEIAQIEEALTDFESFGLEVARMREQKAQAGTELGVARQRLNALDQQRDRRLGIEEAQAQLADEKGIYEELRVAFSRNGIPAMIIEAAIPEIENEANQLLADLTNGRMHVRFDTQRDNVTGGVRETLDIRIADELGTRDYETFSGGEAFRVNFAIRLALSKMLARRAGTRLRTLIIDEGFGSLDELGRDRLIESINAIQDDFDLILVITHIDELKDAFPARIEIVKTSSGAMIQVA